MRQVYYHYTKWEDYQNGMYDEVKEGRKERIEKAIFLLTSPKLCYEFMRRVTREWVHATEQTLTNPMINHQAFLGQTACNLYGGVKEDETREAWGRLTHEQRYKANRIADRVYAEWKRDYTRGSNYYQFSLFEEVEK